MSNANTRGITNNFQDVRLVSLASWSKAAEISPRDRGGPFVVTQEGSSPEDMTVAPDEFILGRSGRWLSLAHFYALPVAERRDEFVFGTAAEVMRVLGALPGKVSLFGRPEAAAEAPPGGAEDEMAAVIRGQGAGGASP